MKKLIISETQYKRLVNNLISEEVIFQNPDDKSDQTPHMMDFLSNLSDTIRIASGKDLYVSKIEKSIIYLDKSKYTEEEKKVINDKSKKYFEYKKNPKKSFGTEELSFFFDYGESMDIADIKDRIPKLIDNEPINVDSNVETGLIYPTSQTGIINNIITKLSTLIPLSKSYNRYTGTCLLQSILQDSGFCTSDDCKKIDGDFGNLTVKSLSEFIGKSSLTSTDIDLLKNKMIEKTKEGKVYNDTLSKFDSKIKERENLLKNTFGIDLNGVTEELRKWYMDYYSSDHKLPNTGDMMKDVLQSIKIREGGISDDPKDTEVAKYPLPFWYDTSTKILKTGKTEINLGDGNYLLKGKLPEKTKSKVYDGYGSDKWHTNKGIIWLAWGGYMNEKGYNKDSFESIKGWLTINDSVVEDIYKTMFYNEFSKYSKYEIINHLLSNIKMGGKSAVANFKTQMESKMKEMGFDHIDKAIQTLGLKKVFNILINMRASGLETTYNAESFSKGWINGILNFHRYFSKYIDK